MEEGAKIRVGKTNVESKLINFLVYEDSFSPLPKSLSLEGSKPDIIQIFVHFIFSYWDYLYCPHSVLLGFMICMRF